jgi:hypothetical protein
VHTPSVPGRIVQTSESNVCSNIIFLKILQFTSTGYSSSARDMLLLLEHLPVPVLHSSP